MFYHAKPGASCSESPTSILDRYGLWCGVALVLLLANQGVRFWVCKLAVRIFEVGDQVKTRRHAVVRIEAMQ